MIGRLSGAPQILSLAFGCQAHTHEHVRLERSAASSIEQARNVRPERRKIRVSRQGESRNGDIKTEKIAGSSCSQAPKTIFKAGVEAVPWLAEKCQAVKSLVRISHHGFLPRQ